MPVIQYWDINNNTETTKQLDAKVISAHLVEDWIPSLAASVGPSFMSWPRHLITTVKINGSDYLALRPEAGKSDRQWKGVLSWMLGVAATREVLLSEGYSWIAPLSAFYPGLRESVDTRLNPVFPNSSIEAIRPANSKCQLMPDYLAVRRRAGGYEWALIESKGTAASLKSMKAARPEWSSQSKNAEVSAYQCRIPISRNIVVAARSNPNAKQARTRRIQVRSWNYFYYYLPQIPPWFVIDVVAAHLFGLCQNLNLKANTAALAAYVNERSVWIGNNATQNEWTEKGLDAQLKIESLEVPHSVAAADLVAAADSELAQFDCINDGKGGWTALRMEVPGVSRFEVEVSSATISLLRTLRSGESINIIMERLHEAEDACESIELPDGAIRLPGGITVT